jgi:DNA-binding MurR/RpiR family transcriptional regulator
MGIQSRIEASAHGFSPAMRRIADALRQKPAIVREMTISESRRAAALRWPPWSGSAAP